ncbi:hypothetical protein JCM21142_1629 [Saccharicrinis fermentans DSM 9555 = JCM 21142]|uniref:Lipoprotein n=1 Tax=Saccharicrinis fermentans DSM 9555 = JCM 21142 TaxID=869213 RepID=W7YHE7_9BACT|nr:hypothetical protein JCM21142_1629 [Saccharicrinis fermentans DSM 9555 = JCM 21142]
MKNVLFFIIKLTLLLFLVLLFSCTDKKQKHEETKNSRSFKKSNTMVCKACKYLE